MRAQPPHATLDLACIFSFIVESCELSADVIGFVVSRRAVLVAGELPPGAMKMEKTLESAPHLSNLPSDEVAGFSHVGRVDRLKSVRRRG